MRVWGIKNITPENEKIIRINILFCLTKVRFSGIIITKDLVYILTEERYYNDRNDIIWIKNRF